MWSALQVSKCLGLACRGGLDRQDPIGAELSAAPRGELIAENPRWVEVRSYRGDPHGDVLWGSVGWTVANRDICLALQGPDRGGDHVGARVSFADPDMPEIARGAGREHLDDAAKHCSERPHIVARAVGALLRHAERGAEGREAKARRESVRVSR